MKKQFEKLLLGSDARLDEKSNKFKNQTRHADLNDVELDLSHRMSKLRLNFKNLTAGLDNPVDNLVDSKP